MASTRAIVIEVDGATLSLVKPWAAQGKLPTFARLFADGAHAEVRTTLPVSPASTSTSAATGKNPGKHGVFGADAAVSDVRVPRVWDVVEAHGRRARVLMHAVEGVAEMASAAAPRAVRARACELQRDQTTATTALLDRQDWDVAWVRFPLLAEVQRRFWHFMDPSHGAHPGATELGDTILEIHRVLDEGLREIVARLDDQTNLLVASDHGACASESSLALPAWLEAAGFLVTRDDESSPITRALGSIGIEAYALVRALRRSGLGWLPKLVSPRSKSLVPGDAVRHENLPHVDWSATRVYCSAVSDGCLRVNLRGREARGIVAPEHFDQVCRDVREALLAFMDPATGRALVRAVHSNSELYDGPRAADGPDLVVEAADFCGFHAGSGGPTLVATGLDAALPTAQPHRYGMCVLVGPAARRGVRAPWLDVCDLAPTLLHLVGIPEEDDMDGSVAVSMLSDEHLAIHPVATKGASPAAAVGRPVANDGPSHQVERQIEGVGYP